MIEDVIKCGKNWSPGSSGIPKGAWFYGGEVNVEYIAFDSSLIFFSAVAILSSASAFALTSQM